VHIQINSLKNVRIKQSLFRKKNILKDFQAEFDKIKRTENHEIFEITGQNENPWQWTLILALRIYVKSLQYRHEILVEFDTKFNNQCHLAEHFLKSIWIPQSLWKENLKNDGHQFHQYQQNEQSPLILTELTAEHKKTTTKMWWGYTG